MGKKEKHYREISYLDHFLVLSTLKAFQGPVPIHHNRGFGAVEEPGIEAENFISKYASQLLHDLITLSLSILICEMVPQYLLQRIAHIRHLASACHKAFSVAGC